MGTVDRVIHNRGKVSPQAYEKVLAALNETGYKPNLLARTLGSNKTYLIAAVVPCPDPDEYWKQSAEGIAESEEEWAQYNIRINSYYFDLYDKNSYKTAAQQALNAGPDAILTAPIFYDEAVDFFGSLDSKEIPYVFYNTDIPILKPVCFIGQDLYQSGKLGAELLDISCNNGGSFAILHIYEDIHNSIHLAEKERGFIDYFTEKNNPNYKAIGIDLSAPKEPSLEIELSSILSDSDVKGLLVTTSKGLHMTASYLEKHNRKDIELVGYDLLPENVKYLRKGYIRFLIHQNPRKQASQGIAYLANLLLFNKPTPEKELFPLQIISRQNLDSFTGSNNHH